MPLVVAATKNRQTVNMMIFSAKAAAPPTTAYATTNIIRAVRRPTLNRNKYVEICANL